MAQSFFSAHQSALRVHCVSRKAQPLPIPLPVSLSITRAAFGGAPAIGRTGGSIHALRSPRSPSRARRRWPPKTLCAPASSLRYGSSGRPPLFLNPLWHRPLHLDAPLDARWPVRVDRAVRLFWLRWPLLPQPLIESPDHCRRPGHLRISSAAPRSLSLRRSKPGGGLLHRAPLQHRPGPSGGRQAAALPQRAAFLPRWSASAPAAAPSATASDPRSAPGIACWTPSWRSAPAHWTAARCDKIHTLPRLAAPAA